VIRSHTLPALAALSLAALLPAASPAQTMPAMPAGPSLPPDQVRSFFRDQMGERDGRKFLQTFTEAVTLAAHPTASNPGLLRIAPRPLQDGVTGFSMGVEYYGGFTNRPYYGTIDLVIDHTDLKKPSVMRLGFSDSNNWIKANQGNLAQLRKKLNEMLEE
jgi:hypothetical protein